MIKIDDVVSVGQKGICKVENITKNAFVGCDENKEYYVLRPLTSANNMVVYFPVDTKMNIRKLVSKQEAENLLNKIASSDDVSVKNEEERFKIYNSIIKQGEFENYLKLIKTILYRKNKMTKKQFNFQEQKILDQVLASVLCEAELVLNKNKDEIKKQITANLKLDIEI